MMAQSRVSSQRQPAPASASQCQPAPVSGSEFGGFLPSFLPVWGGGYIWDIVLNVDTVRYRLYWRGMYIYKREIVV